MLRILSSFLVIAALSAQSMPNVLAAPIQAVAVLTVLQPPVIGENGVVDTPTPTNTATDRDADRHANTNQHGYRYRDANGHANPH